MLMKWFNLDEDEDNIYEEKLQEIPTAAIKKELAHRIIKGEVGKSLNNVLENGELNIKYDHDVLEDTIYHEFIEAYKLKDYRMVNISDNSGNQLNEDIYKFVKEYIG